MTTPVCPGCKAKFSIKQGVCTKCGLPEWQFVGIEDPLERGKAIARWQRQNIKPVLKEIPNKPQVVAVIGDPEAVRKQAKALARAGSGEHRGNKHGRVGVKRATPAR